MATSREHCRDVAETLGKDGKLLSVFVFLGSAELPCAVCGRKCDVLLLEGLKTTLLVVTAWENVGRPVPGIEVGTLVLRCLDIALVVTAWEDIRRSVPGIELSTLVLRCFNIALLAVSIRSTDCLLDLTYLGDSGNRNSGSHRGEEHHSANSFDETHLGLDGNQQVKS